LMGIQVIARPPEEFAEWVRRMNAPTPPDSGTLADRGREIFTTSVCVACHAIEGTNAQGRLGPDLTRLGARRTIGAGLLENTR
ncbi:MAG: c-type cytochrome, partial [Gammaproteobacteria bacterium]|nr:c-type cytochrome [Gemmatimonadota bacterium]NIU78264.1 c-type cytochrome [Gammaproteobacteria bacterium]NIW38285.1 c-type cytochrome [Gemmatimonadota bacterium]NIX23905.1 c-type cytochrome [Actinomycetota bacterium]